MHSFKCYSCTPLHWKGFLASCNGIWFVSFSHIPSFKKIILLGDVRKAYLHNHRGVQRENRRRGPNNTSQGPSRVFLIDRSLEPSAHLRPTSMRAEQDRGRKGSGNPNHGMSTMTRPLPGLSQKSHDPSVQVWNFTRHCWEQLSKSSSRGKGMLPQGWNSLQGCQRKGDQMAQYLQGI